MAKRKTSKFTQLCLSTTPLMVMKEKKEATKDAMVSVSDNSIGYSSDLRLMTRGTMTVRETIATGGMIAARGWRWLGFGKRELQRGGRRRSWE
ncbi:hypothetical protein U1Q18_005005, partial [Sarracenia purpurea var. burkii]